MNHTKTPWKAEIRGDSGFIFCDGISVAYVVRLADAAFICRAVNNFDGLLAVCKAIKSDADEADACGDDSTISGELYDRLSAIIAKAEGGAE